jgi:hypothetical protein
MPIISPSDVALLRILATAKGGQGKGKARDCDVIQGNLLKILNRIEENT